MMNKKLQDHAHFAAKHAGFDPDEAMPLIEEELTAKEEKLMREFFEWLHANNRTFGWNLPDVYAEFRQQKTTTK